MSARLRRAAFASLLVATPLAAGCAEGASAPGASDAGLAASASAWSRDASASGSFSSDEAGVEAPTSPDPDALEELLAAIPKDGGGSTGDDGGTLVGTETGEKEAAKAASRGEADAGATPARGMTLTLGAITLQPDLSSPAVEREGRAQLYWPLVQRCRGEGGEILPPDVVKLHFTIDRDGYIVPASISVTASDPTYERAAECMRRELSAVPFRAPTTSKGNETTVDMTVPSVD